VNGGGKLLYSPAEAAQVLGLGRTKLFALLGSGALPSLRIGVLRRIEVTAVTAYLASLTASDNSGEHVAYDTEED
jgi:excisionase family DNA binding protein